MSRGGERRSELEVLAHIARALGPASSPGVLVGIGDDAAVLEPPAARLVWTIDEAVEGVHFRRDLLSLADVGYRALTAAASDLAAMGARPLAALVSAVIPDDLEDDALDQLVAGERDAAEAIGAPVVGGNLSRGPVLSLATTWLGAADRPLLRGGARPGDVVHLSGALGLAAAGLRALRRFGAAAPLERLAPALAAFRRPEARIKAGLAAAGVAHAAIDVSDGLVRDVGHLARASGVRVVLEGPHVLVSASLREAAEALGEAPLELALHGGEDYALVAALPPGLTLPGFHPVGRCAPAFDGRAPVALAGAGGDEEDLADRGHDHFAFAR